MDDLEPITIQKQFGENLQGIRKSKGISQEELADRVSAHRTYIGMIERGERNPTLTMIYKIMKALKVKMSDLLPDK